MLELIRAESDTKSNSNSFQAQIEKQTNKQYHKHCFTQVILVRSEVAGVNAGAGAGAGAGEGAAQVQTQTECYAGRPRHIDINFPLV